MRKTVTVVGFVVLFASLALAQEHSPYTGQHQRELKALSSEEVEAFLAGHGMGFAKAAELNHYPGPKHVLDLAQELQLTEDQARQAQEIYDEMHEEATRLGKEYVDLERKLDEVFAGREAREMQLRELVLEIGLKLGKVRFAHLKAHLRMVSVLRPDQIAKYDELRGYGDGLQRHVRERRHGRENRNRL